MRTAGTQGTYMRDTESVGRTVGTQSRGGSHSKTPNEHHHRGDAQKTVWRDRALPSSWGGSAHVTDDV
jgi:hypothetical protein